MESVPFTFKDVYHKFTIMLCICVLKTRVHSQVVMLYLAVTFSFLQVSAAALSCL